MSAAHVSGAIKVLFFINGTKVMAGCRTRPPPSLLLLAGLKRKCSYCVTGNVRVEITVSGLHIGGTGPDHCHCIGEIPRLVVEAFGAVEHDIESSHLLVHVQQIIDATPIHIIVAVRNANHHYMSVQGRFPELIVHNPHEAHDCCPCAASLAQQVDCLLTIRVPPRLPRLGRVEAHAGRVVVGVCVALVSASVSVYAFPQSRVAQV
mmetsp:Transcript_47853/g.144741  ORF Transcript_47853/g.144741 Transcript_47853/m.144741 type:complete len:206 (-) Transcript_47853:1178-1795(-)